jgi:two-component system nitrate/nitrite response regulator NarL
MNPLDGLCVHCPLTVGNAAYTKQTVEKYNLTERHVLVLGYLQDGDSNKMLARRMNIVESTVKSHIKMLLKKTNCGNRTQLAIWAFKHGFGEYLSHKREDHRG